MTVYAADNGSETLQAKSPLVYLRNMRVSIRDPRDNLGQLEQMYSRMTGEEIRLKPPSSALARAIP